jgi:predicted NBD/HSP70 family sugar kinase
MEVLMKTNLLIQTPNILDLADPLFRPISLGNLHFFQAMTPQNSIEVSIAIEGDSGRIIQRKTRIFNDKAGRDEENFMYIERLIKSMLWIYGGFKVYLDMPDSIVKLIKQTYSAEGLRQFDFHFMKRIYEKPLTFIISKDHEMPQTKSNSNNIGRHLEGYRIGFDAGGSDRKVSAVANGDTIYSEEVVWYPKLNSDPSYHYEGILDSIKRAMSYLPKVDAIGVSTAGVCIGNRLMVSSLFINVPEPIFDLKVKNIYIDIAKTLGDIPIEIANDGEITALAGSMSMQVNKVLGIAMGTSQASGYVDQDGHVTGWLNELAFVPVDYHPNQWVDPWSKDVGCGVNYFSQDAIIRLAQINGLHIEETLSPADKLIVVQKALENHNPIAEKIYKTMGIYLGFGLAYYREFFDFEHVMILGRVLSGRGGEIIVDRAQDILKSYFPVIHQQITIHLPDEHNRRVGQSIAAASLVNLSK